MRFENYYDAAIGGYSTYTPLDEGFYHLYSATATSISVQGYVNSFWYFTQDDPTYYHPFFITTGSKIRIYNRISSTLYIVLIRMF